MFTKIKDAVKLLSSYYKAKTCKVLNKRWEHLWQMQDKFQYTTDPFPKPDMKPEVCSSSTPLIKVCSAKVSQPLQPINEK